MGIAVFVRQGFVVRWECQNERCPDHHGPINTICALIAGLLNVTYGLNKPALVSQATTAEIQLGRRVRMRLTKAISCMSV